MKFKFSQRSENNIKGIQPLLEAITRRALQISPVDMMVIDGLRTIEEQRINVAKGVSKTMNSRHLTGHAVDIVPWGDFDKDGDIDSKDLFEFADQYKKIAAAMKKAALEHGADLEWGYDKWGWDMPHFQLSWEKHPKGQTAGMPPPVMPTLPPDMAQVEPAKPKVGFLVAFFNAVSKVIARLFK